MVSQTHQLVRRIKAINSSVLKTFDFVKSCSEKQKSLEVASTEKRLLKMPKVAQNLDLDMPIPQSPRIIARSKAIFVWYYLKYLNISCNTAVINAGAVLRHDKHEDGNNVENRKILQIINHTEGARSSLNRSDLGFFESTSVMFSLSTSSWSYLLVLVCCVRNVQLEQKESMGFREVEFPPRITPPRDESATPLGHMKPFGHQRAPEGPVTEYKEVLHPEEFWKKHVLRSEPLVFRQAIKDSPAISKWTDSYLREKYGDLDVLIELKKEDRAHAAKRMNISTFLDCYSTEDVYVVTVLPNPMRDEVQVHILGLFPVQLPILNES